MLNSYINCSNREHFGAISFCTSFFGNVKSLQRTKKRQLQNSEARTKDFNHKTPTPIWFPLRDLEKEVYSYRKSLICLFSAAQ